ncbi:hypothetical protein [Nonomuraea dietziae]|uniref:hypothetical protein n=1 Tax=Nonomuraea dietziae TaxID=65515 RepID=UPI0033C94E2F
MNLAADLANRRPATAEELVQKMTVSAEATSHLAHPDSSDERHVTMERWDA